MTKYILAIAACVLIQDVAGLISYTFTSGVFAGLFTAIAVRMILR